MDTTQIVALLVAERDRLTKAIEALQGTSTAKRRGRPPKNLLGTVTAAVPAAASAEPSKRNQSAASKRAQSEKMKAYWAAKNKTKK